MVSEKILKIPVIGNLVLALDNHIHLNRRLAELDQKAADLKREEAVLRELTLQSRDRIDICETDISNLKNLKVSSEYLENLNILLSTQMTVWGSKERLHLSKKASMYTCLFNTSSGDITVGDYSFAGSNVSILAGSHNKNLSGLLRRDFVENTGCDIVIGNGVWLGSNSTVLGPCTIGDNAVIAAGAVVVPGTNVPANTVYGGVPAKQIGDDLRLAEEFSDIVLNALENADGILFTDGWSELKVNPAKKKIFGHYLTDTYARVLIKEGSYDIKYYLDDNTTAHISINDGINNKEHILDNKEGIIELDVSKDSDNGRDCRYITINSDTPREELMMVINRKE